MAPLISSNSFSAKASASFPTFEIPDLDPVFDVVNSTDFGATVQGSFEGESIVGTDGGEDAIECLGGNDFLSAQTSGDVVRERENAEPCGAQILSLSVRRHTPPSSRQATPCRSSARSFSTIFTENSRHQWLEALR